MGSDKTVSLKNIQDHPIKTSVGSLLAIVVALWAVYRPFLIEDLSADFVTKAELLAETTAIKDKLITMQKGQDAQQRSLDGLVTQSNVASAFQMERGFQDDLEKHAQDKANPPTRRWLEMQQDLTNKRDLATQYKNCVLLESKNCELLQKQLWQ